MSEFRRALLLGVGLTILLFGGFAVAQSGSYLLTDGSVLKTDSGLSVEVGSDRQIPSGNPFEDSQTLRLNGSDFSSAGDSRLVLDRTGSTWTNVSGVDATTSDVTVDRINQDNATVTLSGTATAASVRQIDIAANTTDLVTTAADSTATVEVNTGGRGVIAVDRDTGSAFAEVGPTGQTVTLDIPSGTTRIDLQEGPNSLLFRDAQNARQPVNKSIQFRAEFFERGDDSVFTKNVTGANVSLAGLPKTESFVAFVNDENGTYVSRRTLVDSIFQQNTVYLLKQNASTVNVTFSVEDRTANFGRQSTLKIERPLNLTGTQPQESVYQSVAGDEIGQKAEFTTTLEENVRYRLILSSRDGEERQLGTILPQRSRAYNLIVTGITSNTSDTVDGGVINTTQSITGSGGNTTKTVTFTYQDPSNETTSLDATIHEAGNPSNTFDTFSASQGSLPLGTFKYSNTFSGAAANTSLVVNYTLVRGGESRSGVRAFGTAQQPIDIPLSGAWLQIVGVGMLLVVGGLFSVGNARIGALIIPTLAFVLFVTGILSAVVSITSVGMAFTLAVAINLVKTTDQGVLN